MKSSIHFAHPLILPALLLLLPPLAARAQLFQNLQSLTRTIPVGSGAIDADGKRIDGPRWICTGDFDNDGKADLAVCHLDGGVTVLYGGGNGTFTQQPLVSGTGSLRAMVAADFNGDGRDDLAAAAPYDAKVSVLLSAPGRTFAPPQFLTSFANARNIASGDFDGDGIVDLAAAGPDEWIGDTPYTPGQPKSGVVHFRGTGGGNFLRMGLVPEVGTPHDRDGRLSPVYSLQAFRRPGETKDWLGVTHETSASMWLLQAGVSGKLEMAQTLNWWGGADSGSPYDVDSLRIGTIFAPASSGQMDLIAVMQGG